MNSSQARPAQQLKDSTSAEGGGAGPEVSRVEIAPDAVAALIHAVELSFAGREFTCVVDRHRETQTRYWSLRSTRREVSNDASA